jgi:DNA (cytosine-5)-methyltransferase 1
MAAVMVAVLETGRCGVNGLTAVSLFAGIGGIDLALQRSGIKVVAAVEIDPACRGVLRRHFPEAIIFEDVTEVTGDQLRAAGFVPERGIVCGGWPCQGNSVAGNRGGMADPRSGLWVHVVRLLAELRPRWFLGENVPGLLSVNGGRDIAIVRRDLAQLGYWWAERILDAQFFGVPQRRRRVFFVGCPGDPRGPVEVLLEPEGGDGDPAPGRQARPGTAPEAPGGAVSALQGGGRRGHRIDAEGAAGGHLVAVPVALRGRDAGSQIEAGEAGEAGEAAYTVRASTGGSSHAMVATFGSEGVVHALTSEGADASEDGTGRGTPIVAYALTSRNDRNDREENYVTSLAIAGDFSTPVDRAQTVRSAHGQPGVIAVGFAENQRGEVVESAVSHQLTTGGGKPGQGFPAVRQEALVRRLTPLECERLQGLPDGWTDGQADATRYRQLGNSVAVPVVEWITRRIAAVEARLVADRGAA